VSYFRKVIHVSAEDSPSVNLGLRLRAGGLPLDHPAYDTEVVSGLLTYPQYLSRRATWDEVLQCIGLDGRFYKGTRNLLYPPQWLNLCERRALPLPFPRKGEAIGCDPAEGGDSSSFAVVDRYGLIHLESMRTPDTRVVPNRLRALMTEFGVPPGMVYIDRGGGGQEHADRLRDHDVVVKTVGFGEVPYMQESERRRLMRRERFEERADRYVYMNRRAQMYHQLRLWMEPVADGDGVNPKGSESTRFSYQSGYTELRRQLAVMPLLYDPEGRIYLPPKNRREGQTGKSIKTLSELLGRSPDDADALVLAVHALTTGRVGAGKVGTW
jgi:hypothetical protein